MVIFVTCPDPLQTEQFENFASFDSIFLFTLIFFSTPLIISSRDNFTFILKLDPLTLVWPDLPKPPKDEPKALPNISPNWLNISSIFIPPAPNPPAPSKALWPNWSYLDFLSGSLKISYASAAFLKLASAVLSPGFLSGWYFIASFLYAFFISELEADLDIPNIS